MPEKLPTIKYAFTVEGETERWYLLWLREQINSFPNRIYNCVIDPKVQQSPAKFYKGTTRKSTPEVFHICDVESNDTAHVEKLQKILSEMKEAGTNKNIDYILGYSNFTFELWMVLHKRDCNGSLNHRSQYLRWINQAFGENFENLSDYKQQDNFKKCLSKLSIEDVKEAIRRADYISENNRCNKRMMIQYKGYRYYKDNPSLSIHEVVKKIMSECGVI